MRHGAAGQRPAPATTFPSTTCVCAQMSPSRQPSGSCRTRHQASTAPMTSSPAQPGHEARAARASSPAGRSAPGARCAACCPGGGPPMRVGRCITFTPKMRLPTLWPWSMPSARSRKSSATTVPARAADDASRPAGDGHVHEPRAEAQQQRGLRIGRASIASRAYQAQRRPAEASAGRVGAHSSGSSVRPFSRLSAHPGQQAGPAARRR